MKSNCSKTEKITRAKKLALVIFTLSSNYLVVAEAVGFEPSRFSTRKYLLLFAFWNIIYTLLSRCKYVKFYIGKRSSGKMEY